MKTWYIIKREYLENLRKKSFIISTILAPIILLGFYAIPILAVFFVPGDQISIAVLDRTGRVGEDFVTSLCDTLKDGRPRYQATVHGAEGGGFDERKDMLIARITSGALDVLIELPVDALESGTVNYISKDVFNENTMDDLRDKLNPVIVNQRLAGRGLDYDQISALTQRINLNENKITKSGVLEEEQVVGRLIMVVVFVMILYMTLLSWGMSVQRAIIEEKSSRVIEVMLSSVEPRDLFLGKIIGVGSLGLTQLAIWSVLFLAVGLSSAVYTAGFMNFVQINPMDIVYFLVFFVLGFMIYSALFTIIGAVCSTEQDAQQLQTIVVLPLVLPIMMMFFVIQNPNATLSVVLSYVPLFTPMLMLARIGVSEPSLWEVWLSIAILVISIYAVTLFSARVFRVGILMYGKRPGLREIIRWSRYA
ncbi:MAG: ABC transporter permease [Candidatus Krumholzibacteria bacterium]|nr:ABC transporter permease [Candidatus Krumholzibacteria bacterium]